MSEIIDVTDAIELAIEFVKHIYGERIKDISVEEVELSEEERFWIITLGWIDSTKKTRKPTPIEAATGILPEQPVEYKYIYVDSTSGKTTKMKDV